MFTWLIGVVAGLFLPIQTSINTRMSQWLNSKFGGAMVSMCVGLLVSIVILLASGGSLAIPLELFKTEPFWMWMGGIFGVLIISTNILILPKIGSVETVLFVVFGQILSGLVIDNFGFFRQDVISVSLTRILGAAVLCVGVFITTTANSVGETDYSKAVIATEPVSETRKWLYRLMGVFGGCCGSVQAAVNGYLGSVVGSTPKATFISFLGGVLLLVVIMIVITIKNGPLKPGPKEELHFWMFLGGLPGVGIVFATVILVQMYGTGMSIIVAIVGQIIGGVLVDVFGICGMPKKKPTAAKMAGLLIVVAGAMIVKLL